MTRLFIPLLLQKAHHHLRKEFRHSVHVDMLLTGHDNDLAVWHGQVDGLRGLLRPSRAVAADEQQGEASSVPTFATLSSPLPRQVVAAGRAFQNRRAAQALRHWIGKVIRRLHLFIS